MFKFGNRGDFCELELHALSVRDRFMKPTEQQIAAMMKSLDDNGQLTPVIVTPVTRTTYRVVAGATRVLAATRLHWLEIDCLIMHGSEESCRIVELTENLDRKNLTAAQRKEVRAERKRLIHERIASQPPAKGGRGKKGGVSATAREFGVSRRTVDRAADKPAQNSSIAQVSKTETVKKPSRSDPIDHLLRLVKQLDAPRRQRFLAEIGTQARAKKRPSRDAQKRELAPEDLPGDTLEQQWQFSLGNMSGEAVSLPSFWDKTFGEEWKSFAVPSDLITLARQAADAWAQIADELTTRGASR